MDVKNLMTRGVFAVVENTAIASAAQLLSDQKISGAPVVCKDGRPVGMLCLRNLADPACPSEGVVADIMSRRVVCIDSSASLREAADLMVTESLHQLLVIEDERMVGILTALDILPGLLRQLSD